MFDPHANPLNRKLIAQSPQRDFDLNFAIRDDSAGIKQTLLAWRARQEQHDLQTANELFDIVFDHVQRTLLRLRSGLPEFLPVYSPMSIDWMLDGPENREIRAMAARIIDQWNTVVGRYQWVDLLYSAGKSNLFNIEEAMRGNRDWAVSQTVQHLLGQHLYQMQQQLRQNPQYANYNITLNLDETAVEFKPEIMADLLAQVQAVVAAHGGNVQLTPASSPDDEARIDFRKVGQPAPAHTEPPGKIRFTPVKK